MRRSTPASRGLEPSIELAPCGRASRWQAADGGELWRLPSSDEIACDRLMVLGQRNVGGFVDGGVDDAGVWLVRRLPGVRLGEHLRDDKGPMPWRKVAAIGVDLARALSACEKASLFAGPLTPDSVLVRDGGASLPADRLVAALFGGPAGGARAGAETVAALWTPPEQADGAVWDAAANRYALGLVLYRLLAGAHPFGGAGLRRALGEASRREPSPFEDVIAVSLPAGLQSLVLHMLDPERARRPPSASAIAVELDHFLDDGTGPRRALPITLRAPDSGQGWESHPPQVRTPPAPPPSSPRVPWTRRARALWPVAVGLLLAALALALLAPEPPPASKPAIAPPEPLGQADTSASACGTCHARQASEWRRSIMAHAVKSPLFNALESLIEEQVGRDADCPNGAGILRRVDPSRACRDKTSGVAVTGSGGEHWCVSCHSPGENLEAAMPAWDGRAGGDPRTRRPVRDLLGDRAMEGISCAFCHQVHGPVGARGSRGYQGNPTWTSFVTGDVFPSRPEDARGLTGIANSGYELRPDELLLGRGAGRPLPSGRGAIDADAIDPVVHARPGEAARAYLRSSEFCGACHDVRLFGSDAIAGPRGEHFKRLRNAYSEWASWAAGEQRAGRAAATCQDCHMSTFPGVCVADASAGPGESGPCPQGTRFVARAPGERPLARVADNSPSPTRTTTHYFSGVDLPLAADFPDALVDEAAIDANGVPLSAKRRRDMLLQATFRFALGEGRRVGSTLEVPIDLENIRAGHRVPAGFSQEREIWVELTVRDERGRVLYQVGRVERGDEDLRDKVLTRVSTRSDRLDRAGRPEGLFGADVRDGPDAPRWDPPPDLGGTSFRGQGLVSLQNGFLRCVRCIGTIGRDGACEPLPGQEAHRGDRFADGDYDLDTGECRSNLRGRDALFETYFPVGALDASRGVVKGPDAIIDTRSLPPGVPVRYTFVLPGAARAGPVKIEARLMFRAFPPFLVKAFAAYEREQARQGLRPSGPLVTEAMLDRLEVVEVARRTGEIR